MPLDPPIQEIEVSCPYCGETVAVVVEADLAGELVQDCEVCCNPWTLRVVRDEWGVSIAAGRLDD